MFTRSRIGRIAVLLALSLLAGCGGDDQPTATQTPRPTLTPTPRNAPSPTPFILYATGDGNIRECPPTVCHVVGTLTTGDVVRALGTVTGDAVSGSNRWIVIEYGVFEAYVHASLLSPNPP